MKKIQLGILALGLGLVTITAQSSFSRFVPSLHGFDANTNQWISLEGYTEAEDPEDVQSGEYICIDNPNNDCTALMENPNDTPTNVRAGDLFVNP